jgi:hypothetical protein
MKMKMKGSIYQGGGAGMGLPVQDGRLVNNRPDGMTGIQQIAMARKTMKREAKIQMQADAYVRGEQMAEMSKMMSSMIGGCSCGKPNCKC